MEQGEFKNALETIASIMTGSIGEVAGTSLNLDTEDTTVRIISETSEDLNAQVSTEVDSITVATSDSEAIIESIIDSVMDSVIDSVRVDLD